MALSLDWDGLLIYLAVSQAARLSKAAAITFVVCDICWTLEDEISYEQRHLRGNLKKNHRKPFQQQLRVAAVAFACKIFLHWYSLAGDIVYMTTANVICILRIYALYNRNVKVLILFIGLSLCKYTPS
ncbi:hypothetical protein CC2G_004515 [Coprinopsis cinerea AmutBmut pab1-1]|nr:hypothetical protein CC2G_004515 [Coprinopsis cinerea AmutBmut pab1-1]